MNSPRFNRGISLVEMMIVASILAMAAAIVVPTLQSSEPQAVDQTVSEVKQALIYARDEAIRTTSAYGVVFDDPARSVTVVHVDTSVLPLVPIYDVYHPASKQPYVLDLNANQTDALPSIVWSGTCADDMTLLFDRYGRARCMSDFSVMAEMATIKVTLRNLTRTIELDGETGRINAT